ncbi:type III pantothenate kinase [Balneolaceae bacterium YR4-1]|uniref:Type III pantothenate kinase n=1 Tax=Halalkalibaculum roseum TaxID=2709311 RepID=A0A6M1SXP0_9BACT|nr:type III pantothenate kinase [Halalkalibaculum roseum]NGP77812.1 type III pantothenate kinase [Halalkalibaculum roseum]
MFLAVDAGNSNIVLGIYDGGEWIQVWRIETEKDKGSDDYRAIFLSHFEQADIPLETISGVMIASVVPHLTDHLQNALHELTGIMPLILGHHTDSGISLEADNPKEIGPDLIAGAVGAYHSTQDTCIVVDFGTATTLVAVEQPGRLTGGVICAGLKITIDALIGRTALLGDIPLRVPSKVLATDTVGAMQSGLIRGHACMVEGLINKIKEEIGQAQVVATGGLAETLAPYIESFDRVDPLLTLDGMRMIYDRRE